MSIWALFEELRGQLPLVELVEVRPLAASLSCMLPAIGNQEQTLPAQPNRSMIAAQVWKGYGGSLTESRTETRLCECVPTITKWLCCAQTTLQGRFCSPAFVCWASPQPHSSCQSLVLIAMQWGHQCRLVQALVMLGVYRALTKKHSHGSQAACKDLP